MNFNHRRGGECAARVPGARRARFGLHPPPVWAVRDVGHRSLVAATATATACGARCIVHSSLWPTERTATARDARARWRLIQLAALFGTALAYRVHTEPHAWESLRICMYSLFLRNRGDWRCASHFCSHCMGASHGSCQCMEHSVFGGAAERRGPSLPQPPLFVLRLSEPLNDLAPCRCAHPDHSAERQRA